jgi:hypothetical protein
MAAPPNKGGVLPVSHRQVLGKAREQHIVTRACSCRPQRSKRRGTRGKCTHHYPRTPQPGPPGAAPLTAHVATKKTPWPSRSDCIR